MNLEELMKAAQNVQDQMAKAQDTLDGLQVEGAAGGGMVKITATAKGRIVAIAIDDSMMQLSEKQMLEDLVIAAFNDAKTKADVLGSQEMSKLTAGLPLPPGFKLPM